MLEMTYDKVPWKNVEIFKSPILFQLQVWPSIISKPVIVNGDWSEELHDNITRLKNGIGKKEQENNWDLVKRITNPYELIFTSSKHVVLPKSVSILKPLSRSFFKLIEILEITKFFETVKPANYKTLHLCEGPGGFIEAFIDRAQRYRKSVQYIYAMTLKQTNHNIPGWRAASKFLARHPEIHIEYGPSLTGDIIVAENQNYICEKLKNTCHLVTADGGFDFSIDFEAQEKLVFPLLAASAYIALGSLAPGGMFVLKIFDSYSNVTQEFIALLAVHFREYTIYKPATSRPCNSERYFIGIKFRGPVPKETMLALRAAQTINISSLWPEGASIVFGESTPSISTIVGKYVDEQNTALQRVLSFPVGDIQNKEINHVWSEQEKLCVNWCQAFHIPWRQIR